MKKRINIRNMIIIVLCITIILMAIGFACISAKIEKNMENNPYFDIAFSDVTAATPVKGGTVSPYATNSITNQGKTINMEYNLSTPGDELAYTITIKNNGNISAEIINILESPNYTGDESEAKKIEPVVINHNDIVGKTLEPGEETELKITVIYQETKKVIAKQLKYQLTILASSPQK